MIKRQLKILITLFLCVWMQWIFAGHYDDLTPNENTDVACSICLVQTNIDDLVPPTRLLPSFLFASFIDGHRGHPWTLVTDNLGPFDPRAPQPRYRLFKS